MAKLKAVAGPVSLNIPGLSLDDEGAPAESLVLSVRGLEGTGKSFLAGQGPNEIAYFSVDAGVDRVIAPLRAAGRLIHLGAYEYMLPSPVLERDENDYDKVAKHVMGYLRKFRQTWHAAIAEPRVRTMVQDSCSEIWQMYLLANFGKLEQNERTAYGPINSAFMGDIKAAKRAGKVVVLIHQMKARYADKLNERTGKVRSEEVKGEYDRQGMSKINYVYDVEVEARYLKATPARGKIAGDPARFEVEVLLNKLDMTTNGLVFDSPSFAELATALKPSTDPAWWE